jgi:hypothetical protein
MKQDDKVTIKQGYGYTDYTNGIERFCRALEPIKGVIITINKNTLYIKTDDNRKVHTDKNCVELG